MAFGNVINTIAKVNFNGWMPILEMLCFTLIFVSSYIFLSVNEFTQASAIGFDNSSEPDKISHHEIM